MPEEFKIEASNENAASNQSTEALNEAPVSIFDQPFEIQSEDDDLSTIEVNHYNNDNDNNPEPDTIIDPVNPKSSEDTPQQLDFNKKPEAPAEGQQTQEEIIEDLQKKGFNITAPGSEENVDPRVEEIKQLKFHIGQGKQLIASEDDPLIKEKFTDDLRRKYTSQKREHLIGTEEFNLELEQEIDELNENRYNKKIVADNIRRDVQGYMNERIGKLEKINSNISAEHQISADKNRNQLQEQFTNFHKEGFMGIDIPANVAEEVYRDIVSGDFNKKIKSNHNLVAQFALFAKLQESFAEKLGQPTYGEGVKAAFDQIKKGGNDGVRNPLAAMSSASGDGSRQSGDNNASGRFQKPAVKSEGNLNSEDNNDNRFG